MRERREKFDAPRGGGLPLSAPPAAARLERAPLAEC